MLKKKLGDIIVEDFLKKDPINVYLSSAGDAVEALEHGFKGLYDAYASVSDEELVGALGEYRVTTGEQADSENKVYYYWSHIRHLFRSRWCRQEKDGWHVGLGLGLLHEKEDSTPFVKFIRELRLRKAKMPKLCESIKIQTSPKKKESAKCLVKGCPNRKNEGEFIGDLCLPCYNMLTSGTVKYGRTFINDMQTRINHLSKEKEQK